MAVKFWMVAGMSKGGGVVKAPTVQHTTEHTAKAEAERLSLANPGQEFVVLEATESVRKSSVEWQHCYEAPLF